MTILTRVYEASAPDALHVVFVHGLGGNERSTWMHNPADDTTFWPSWIGQEVGCNVWVGKYGAAPSGWTGAAGHLADLGETLFTALQVEGGLRECKIVLVGHSLGGLVIKSGMTQAQTLGDPKRLAVLKRIAGVVFIGTPHQGSNLATLADVLRIPFRTNQQVTNMVRDDAWLKLLNDQFRALQKQRDFDLRVFFESKGILIGCRFFFIEFGTRQLVVDRNSSDPGIAGVIPTAIEGDHIEIAKPKSRHELIYKSIVDFLGHVASRPVCRSLSGGSSPATWLNSTDFKDRIKRASAPLMSWPSTLGDGTWLHRPELDSLIESLAAHPSSNHFLLGDPGCGKSSLLVRLAEEKQTAGWCVLAIKADRLPPEILNREALAQHLNLGADLSTALRALGKSEPVLLIVDQVDALADLVVQHSARLRVLLDLVQDLSEVEGVHTVISCRTFEQKHDPALRNLNATVVQLELPEWSSVQPILTLKGLQAEVWNKEIKEVLRSPHALDIFLSLLGGVTEPEVLNRFHGLLEKLWEKEVLIDPTGKRRTTLRLLAKAMADREVLGLPLAQVEEHYAEIRTLEAAGLLRVDNGPGRVEFRHQTLYEFVRARSFLNESGSLTEAVRLQQSSLRIRPQLWHALGYFRGASPDDYGIELEKLWASDLRLHLKILLIEFLGLQTVPTVVERRLVQKAMTDPWFLPRFFGAAAGSPGWFDSLLPSHLPGLMGLPVEQAQMLLPMLRQALLFNAESVVELVRRHWLPQEERDLLTWQVLGGGDVAPQSGSWFDSLVIIAGRTLIADWAIAHLSGVVSATSPAEAPRLFAAWLERQINIVKAQTYATPTDQEGAAENAYESLRPVLEARQFHDLEAISEAAPRAFIECVWPPFLECLHLCSSQVQRRVVSYHQSNGLVFQQLDDDEGRHERPLLRSVQMGMQGWAASDPEGFLEFVATHETSDLVLVHRLLATGLVRTAAHSPLRVVNYLLGDPRRLVLGPYTDVHKESVALIEAVCPQLDDAAYAQIEATLREWRFYDEAVTQDDAGTRQYQLKRTRKHRLRLLRALPAGRRSPAVQKLINEEERAFPGLNDKDAQISGFQSIESPVTAKQMDLASEADVLNLFDELTDESEWDHPRHRMKGGAIQAGRELAQLAKSNPSKVLRIIRSLDPERNETPVSCALRELVPAGLTAATLYSLVSELEDKGFIGLGFRHDAAYAISNASSRETPVPLDLVDRMEHWLVANTAEDATEVETAARQDISSVLWGHGSSEALPNGNYPTLSALTSACLNATPPRLDRWLSILEQHVMRPELARVWEAMILRELTHLRTADRSRAEALIDRLIKVVPRIVDGRSWAHFVAHGFRWASANTARNWLAGIVERDGSGMQGAGELACLRHALFPAEDWSRSLVEVFVAAPASATALGVAHGVANLWHEPMTRPVVHPLLLKLLRSGNDLIHSALSEIFLNDGFAADTETRELLDVLATYPDVLRNGRAEHLPEKLAKLVAFEPDKVCQLVDVLLDTVGEQLGDITTSWYLSTEWLVDVALQLQDMGIAERMAGSAFFERMLEFNIPQAKEMALDLDKRMTVGSSPRASVRRRRGKT